MMEATNEKSPEWEAQGSQKRTGKTTDAGSFSRSTSGVNGDGDHESPLSRVLARLNAKPSGDGYIAHCPAHDDRSPSLSVQEAADGKVIFHCFAGCPTEAVRLAMGLTWDDLFPPKPRKTREMVPWGPIVATYDYRDEAGTLLFQVVRYDRPKKAFPQRRPNGTGGWVWGIEGIRRVLYRLPDLLDADTVYIVEGEKDVENLRALGIVATCNAGGAETSQGKKGKWRDEYNPSLAGKHIVILPDNDEPGERHALAVARALLPGAASVRIVRLPGLPPKGDVSDWLKEGHGVEELLALVDSTATWTEQEERSERADDEEPTSEPQEEPSEQAHDETSSSGGERADDESEGRSAEPPRPLRRELPEPSPFPVESLADLAAVTHKLRGIIQAPPALCGQSVLAATALAVQGHADILIDGRVIPLSENFITVGESGERKSAVDREALRPHREYEKELVDGYARETERYENDLAAFKKAREEALRKSKSRDDKRRSLDAIGPPPQPPLIPVLATEEPTYEGLIKLLLLGHPSLGLFSDEGGRFIGGYGMSETEQLKTAAGLSELWDGKRVSRVRGGDGAVLLYGRRLSTHLMSQPAVAQKVLGNAQLIDQGLLSRCLVTWPTSTAGTRMYVEKNLREDSDIAKYNARITEILKTPLPLAEGKRNELSPRILTLSRDAKSLWVKFHNGVEERLAENQQFAPIKGFANKAPEHALRLAGILTLYQDLFATQVAAEVMAKGIDLVQHYLDEALRLFNASQIDADIVLGEKLLAWAQAKHTHVSLVDIYQRGPNPISDAKTAGRIASLLADHGWFRLLQGGKTIDGVFRRKVWQVVK